MKFICFNTLFIAFVLVCEVVSDYSESMLPSKDHRTMRMNVRVGKRFDESMFDEDEAINKRELPNPKRRLRLVFRPGKRNHGDEEKTQFLIRPQEGTLEDYSIKAPKRRLRVTLRTGKRSVNFNEQDYTSTPLSQIYTDSQYDDLEDPDPKRSPSHFLMMPRVGKNDRKWKIFTLNNLQKRSDPKSTDLWFGPRLGRANNEDLDSLNYLLLNGNKMSELRSPKSLQEDQPPEEIN